MVEEYKLKLYNAQAEIEVIAACVNDPNIFDYVREELSKELFTDYDCQKTYLIMRQLDAAGQAPDIVEMGGLLAKNNVNIGKFITTGISSSEITRQRILHLQDLSIRRQLLALFYKGEVMACDQTASIEYVQKLYKELLAVTNSQQQESELVFSKVSQEFINDVALRT